jgi:energy-coupling factor transport system permease protein
VIGAEVRRTPISAANPVTKLAASLIITVALVLTVDVVSAATALVLELAVLPWAGLSARTLARVFTPIVISAVLAGLVTALIGIDGGRTLLAVALPGVVLVMGTDPTDLADALAQRLRLPARFVLGALAGLRLVGVLTQEWRSLEMARRARGLGDGTGPVGSARRFIGQAFALLVMAIRRGTRLAMAMEARGFGSPTPRTWARRSTFAARDGWLLAGAVTITAAAVTASVAAGTWTFVLG